MKVFTFVLLALIVQDPPAGDPAEFRGTLAPVHPKVAPPPGALIDRLFLPDGQETPLPIRVEGKADAALLKFGERFWVKGRSANGILTISELRVLKGAAALPPAARGKAADLQLVTVYPWCDHMPGIGGKDERRQYLVVTVKITNRRDEAVTAKLDSSTFSFDEDQLGDAAGLTLRGEDGRGSGRRDVTLKAGEEKTVDFRVDGMFPEGKHGATLYIAMTFSAAGETLKLRHSGVIHETS